MARITVDFYQASVQATPAHPTMPDVWTRLSTLNDQTHQEGTTVWEFRDVAVLANGRVRGALAKLRQDNLPKKAKRGGAEAALDLEDDEGLLEKAHFQYDVHRNIFLWQANKNCGGPNRVRMLLHRLLAADVRLSAIIQAGAAERILDGEGTLKAVQVTLARPTNPELFDADNFSGPIMNVLANNGGDRITVWLKTDARLKMGNPLSEGLRAMFASLATRDEVETAKIEVEDDEGNINPIDLVADRIRSYQDVDQHGKYPSAEAVYAAFDAALTQRSSDLDAIFGP